MYYFFVIVLLYMYCMTVYFVVVCLAGAFYLTIDLIIENCLRLYSQDMH